MFHLFKKIPFFVRFYLNEIEVRRIDTNTTVKRRAKYSFSSERLVIADFWNAEKLLSEIIHELLKNEGFALKRIVMIIQQAVEYPDGISEIEKRAYRDLAEHVGAVQVEVLQDSKEISISRIKAIVK